MVTNYWPLLFKVIPTSPVFLSMHTT